MRLRGLWRFAFLPYSFVWYVGNIIGTPILGISDENAEVIQNYLNFQSSG